MSKLLNAGFSTLRKNKVFYAMVIIEICLALFLSFNRSFSAYLNIYKSICWNRLFRWNN